MKCWSCNRDLPEPQSRAVSWVYFYGLNVPIHSPVSGGCGNAPEVTP